MKIKLSLNSEDVLNKRFDVSLKGYNAREVDYFLDLIKKDYERFELFFDFHMKEIDKLNSTNKKLLDNNRNLKNYNNNLKNQLLQYENKGLNNADILKRINSLEEKSHHQK